MVLALVLSACSGGGGPGAGDGGTTPAEVAADAPSPLRRLTPAQYRNTVRDLFPGVDLPPLSLLADPEVHGFDNNAETQAATPLAVEQWQVAAVEVTAAAWAQPDGWLPCTPDGGADPAACGHALLDSWLPLALRRPVAADEDALYRGLFDDVLDEEGSLEIAAQVALQAVLNSPDFLYLIELGVSEVPGPRTPLTGAEVASRMSYLLWGSMPDDPLLAAAASGELTTPEGVEAQAWRMIEDPRFSDALADFHRQWLDLDHIDNVVLDAATYPVWEQAWTTSLRGELDELVDRVYRGGEPTLGMLLLDPNSDADDALAEIYGVSRGYGPLPLDQRAGMLTRAGWLASTAHPVDPSPVKRGVFVRERLLCVPTAPPPPDVDTDLPEATTGGAVTNRDRYVQHSAEPRCASCHVAIDGIGFGFESYDSLGRFRTTDNGAPVDATGDLHDGDLDGQLFDGAVELSGLLAGSRSVHDCAALQWYRFAHGRTEATGEALALESLRESYWQSGGELPQLLVDIVRSDLFRTRRADP